MCQHCPVLVNFFNFLFAFFLLQELQFNGIEIVYWKENWVMTLFAAFVSLKDCIFVAKDKDCGRKKCLLSHFYWKTFIGVKKNTFDVDHLATSFLISEIANDGALQTFVLFLNVYSNFLQSKLCEHFDSHKKYQESCLSHIKMLITYCTDHMHL